MQTPGAMVGSQPGSAPELNLSSAGMLQFFHSLGKCSLTVTQGPGVRPAQVTAYRLSTRRIQGLLPEEPQTLCQERVCTRGRVITTISRSSWVDSPCPACSHKLPSIPAGPGPSPKCRLGKEALACQRAEDAYMPTGTLDLTLSVATSAHKAGPLSPRERGAASTPQSLPTCGAMCGVTVPHPKSLEAKRAWLWPASSLFGDPIL